MMQKCVLTGFDSAWTRSNYGAVVSLITEDGKRSLNGPHTASFDKVLAHIDEVGQGATEYALAIDQPLVVTGDTGRRPVEDVVSHVMGSFGSAVQPANRSKEEMFGDNAPIWPFLERLGMMGFQHDHHAMTRTKVPGRFYFEVYPALGNLGLFPDFYISGKVPKYNPDRRTFNLADWRLLNKQVSGFLERQQIQCPWLGTAQTLVAPSKTDQDKLDALICLCHAICWTQGGGAVVVGNMATGYMVVPAHDSLRDLLHDHAKDHGVDFWP